MTQSKQPTIAILGAGSMGSAIGRTFTQGGARVLTSLEGRSAASAARAREASMEDASLDDLVACDFILSIVPPSVAVDTAQRLAPLFERASAQPVYIDCNAINPATVGQIERALEPTRTPFVDASIIGQPSAPKFYMSGPHAKRTQLLADHGLVVRVLDGPNGAASALKMSYAGITKGLTALGSAMALAAMRNGAGDALLSELAASQPALAAWLAGNAAHAAEGLSLGRGDGRDRGVRRRRVRGASHLRRRGRTLRAACERQGRDGRARTFLQRTSLTARGRGFRHVLKKRAARRSPA